MGRNRDYYLSPKRVPPSRSHLQRVLYSLLDTFVSPHLKETNQEEEVKWKLSNALIPSLSWTHFVNKDEKVQLVVEYAFNRPNSIKVTLLKLNTESKLESSLEIVHTLDLDYKNTLKGSCAINLANQYGGKLSEIESKIPSTLYDYVHQCWCDEQDFGIKKELKNRMPDSFKILIYNKEMTQSAKIGSLLSYSPPNSEFVLDPSAFYLESSCYTRCININGKTAQENIVFNGDEASPEFIKESMKSAPDVFNSLISVPEQGAEWLYSKTATHLNKLCDSILEESHKSLRYISDLDLSAHGGGISSFTVDLSYPTDSQRVKFVAGVESHRENTLNVFLSRKNDLISTVTKLLSYFPRVKELVKTADSQNLIFENGSNWNAWLIENGYTH